MGKRYNGETWSFLFRCRHQCGRPVDFTDRVVSALLRDDAGAVLFRFSSAPAAGARDLRIDRNYVFFQLLPADTKGLVGSYVVEIKVRERDEVMIEMTKKFKSYPSVIGEELTL